jgi:hypothetical protein
MRSFKPMEVFMKRSLISAFTVFALLAAATTALRSQSSATAVSVGPAGMMSVQELHAAAGLNKLPIEEFEDLSLVYSTAPKH